MGPLQRSQSHPETQFCWPSTRTSRAGESPQVPSPGPCSCGCLPNCQRHLPGQKTGNPDAGFSASPSYSQSSLLPTASGDVLLILSTFILILLRAQPSIHFSHSPLTSCLLESLQSSLSVLTATEPSCSHQSMFCVY